MQIIGYLFAIAIGAIIYSVIFTSIAIAVISVFVSALIYYGVKEIIDRKSSANRSS